jgi:hypothetical protein
MIKTISYLGLGTMGSGMAANLLKASYQLTVWNRSTGKYEPFARKGARVADTPANAVRDAELVMYSLSNDQAVEEVVFGAEGILSGIKEGQIAIDVSTVLPATSLREQEAYAKRGVDFLDAPVFGSRQESAESVPDSGGWDPVPGSTGRQAADSLGEDEDAEGRSESAQLFEEGVTAAEHDQMRQASRAEEKSDEPEP